MDQLISWSYEEVTNILDSITYDAIGKYELLSLQLGLEYTNLVLSNDPSSIERGEEVYN